MTEKTKREKPKPEPAVPEQGQSETPAEEVGGRNGPEPTRYGDWEVGGICTDF